MEGICHRGDNELLACVRACIGSLGVILNASSFARCAAVCACFKG